MILLEKIYMRLRRRRNRRGHRLGRWLAFHAGYSKGRKL